MGACEGPESTVPETLATACITKCRGKSLVHLIQELDEIIVMQKVVFRVSPFVRVSGPGSASVMHLCK